jgi:hypothetical protein
LRKPYVYLSYIWGPTRLRCPLLEASGQYLNRRDARGNLSAFTG